MLEGIRGFHDFARFRIDVEMSLRRTRQSVGIVQSGIEPLGGIGRGHLMREHVAQLVVKRGAVLDGLEISVRFAPVCPAAGQAFEHLPGVALSSDDRLAVRSGQRITGLITLRNTRLSKVLLSQDVDGELRPGFRDIDFVQLEDGRSIRIAYLRRAFHELQPFIGTLSGTCESPFYSHDASSLEFRAKCSCLFKTPTEVLGLTTHQRIQESVLFGVFLMPPRSRG